MQKVTFKIIKNQNFVDFNLYQFGKETCEPGHSFGPAQRNHYLFHYILSGRGTLFSDNSQGHTNTYKLHAGQGFLIVPKQINTYIADVNTPWEYTWLEFDGLHVKQYLESSGLTINQPVYRSEFPELREQMKREMLYIVDCDDVSDFHLLGHLYLFMDYLTRSVRNVPLIGSSRLRELYVREAVSFMEKNFKNEISIEEIAKSLGLNRSYFTRIFRLATGKTPQTFLMNYRMIKAAELLTLSDLRISEIGEEVGYSSQINFSRAFKNIYSVSPREWRNTHKVINQH